MAHFDKFDICAAYALFGSLYNASGLCMHPKSGREINIRIHHLGYQNPCLSEESLSENAREIFEELERLEKLGSKTPTPSWVKHVNAWHAEQAKKGETS